MTTGCNGSIRKKGWVRIHPDSHGQHPARGKTNCIVFAARAEP